VDLTSLSKFLLSFFEAEHLSFVETPIPLSVQVPRHRTINGANFETSILREKEIVEV